MFETTACSLSDHLCRPDRLHPIEVLCVRQHQRSSGWGGFTLFRSLAMKKRKRQHHAAKYAERFGGQAFHDFDSFLEQTEPTHTKIPRA